MILGLPLVPASMYARLASNYNSGWKCACVCVYVCVYMYITDVCIYIYIYISVCVCVHEHVVYNVVRVND